MTLGPGGMDCTTGSHTGGSFSRRPFNKLDTCLAILIGAARYAILYICEKRTPTVEKGDTFVPRSIDTPWWLASRFATVSQRLTLLHYLQL